MNNPVMPRITCRSCHHSKDVILFAPSERQKAASGLAATCDECFRKYRKNRKIKTTEGRWEHHCNLFAKG